MDEITRVIASGGRVGPELFESRYPPLDPGLKRFGDAGAREAAAAELGVGTVLDDYRITGVIGRGGMGVVYEAEQVSLKRTVALKVLPLGALQGGRSLDRFRREASAVARLSHPRIVAIHGFNEFRGVAYLAMERVRGPDLGEIIDRMRAARTHGRRFVPLGGADGGEAAGRGEARAAAARPAEPDGGLDLRNYAELAASFAADACDALRHAHAHGVIHRDIKPSNLLLADHQRVKVADFGLARVGQEGSLTKSGDFVGSPQYVSPEQASSRRAKVDERTDVYSLGVTLYELLTLHQPFAGKNVHDTLRRIIAHDPPPPSRLNTRIPRDLETVVLKAIEKDPAGRYASAGEFGDDLRRFLNFEPILARPPGAAALAWRALRRHRVPLVLGVMGAMILVLASILLASRDDGRGTLLSLADQLATGAGDAAAADAEGGVLALVDRLGDAAPTSARLAVVSEVARRIDAEIAAGRLDSAARMVSQLELRARIGLLQPQTRELLAGSLAGLQVELVRRAREALAAGGEPSERRHRLALLESMLGDDDVRVVTGAAMTLAEVADPSSLGALLDALAERGDVAGRVTLVSALARFGDGAVVPHLVELTRDPSPDLRYAALDALDRLDPPGLERLVGHLGRDEQSWIRWRAQLVVGRLSGR